jgi:phosphate transport system substrate-binding protein
MNRVSIIQNFINFAFRNKKINSYYVVKNKIILRLWLFLFLVSCGSIFLVSCGSMGKKATNETPTRGNIKISVDESFQPVIDAEVYTFTHLYTSAHITPMFKPEYDVMNDFMNDSVNVIVTSKKLTDYQIQTLRDTLIFPHTTTYAYDGLALVTNKENKDTLLTYNSIRDIFLGKIKKWNEINPKSKSGTIRVIFDNNKSGNIRYFKELFEIKDSLTGNFFAVNTNPEVINFVSNNPDALGIVSVNWISDKHDSTARNFIKKVNIIAVSQEFVNDGSYYWPQQGAILNKSYPFVREVYIINRETFAGLGSGFTNWVCAEQGQRIVLKSGLVPATMPIRLVQVKH